MQFAARAYPTLVPSDGKIVKCRVTGFDMMVKKTKRAERISKHMSYQVLEEMDDWEEDMDKLLICLPIAGTCFKRLIGILINNVIVLSLFYLRH